MFSQLFYRKNSTIYENYCLYKRICFWSDDFNDIRFISKHLIQSGLEDVVSLDNKWHDCDLFNDSEYSIVDYLKFLVQLIKIYHKNHDQFNTCEDIENL
mgnify:CR=1 FL=1|jgi:hypothetical protein